MKPDSPVRCLLALVMALLCNPATVTGAADSQWRSVAGPVSARIVRIIDGDTLEVEAHPWPGHSVRVSVRLRGIDTPERERLVGGYPTVELVNVSGGKHYGRVLADMKAGNRDIASAMLASGLARPYTGGKRHRPQCAG